ncbi:MAG: DnaJ domain-containing protein [Deltaproteobacteria bacterium]|nr:DnaJ domain-containing protein [Deltaproteobacteria bacterium]MBW2136114.1 DnaJ domain-containing protein [Deltaproteobacteria bacterium]
MKFLLYLLPLLYILSPYDLLPDFLVGWGWIDDLLVLGLLWYHYSRYKKKRQHYQNIYNQYRRARSQGRSQGRGWQGQDFEGEENIRRSPEKRDPYEVLGIDRTASGEEIRTAYRRLVSKYHPDKVVHLGEEFQTLAEEKFKEIQEAYQALTSRSPSR